MSNELALPRPGRLAALRELFTHRAPRARAPMIAPTVAAPALPVAATPVSRAKAVRMYAAAQYNRLTADWQAWGTSSDAELRISLRVLRNRSRQLVRDNDYAKNAMRVIKNNVVGQGIRLQAQIMNRRGDALDQEANKQIEQLWERWSRKQNCHTAGVLAFGELQRVLLGAVVESGDVLVRKIRGQAFADSPVPFALEIIEADQLVEEWSGRAENGNQVRMGVEVDRWQRPVAYWMYPYHPGDYQFLPATAQTQRLIRVPAKDIYHLFVAERPGATRAAPWLHSTLRRLNDMGGYETAEIVAARASAGVMGFIKTPDIGDPATQDPAADSISDDIQDNQTVADFEPGTIKKLAEGEEFTGWNPARPNAQMDPFLRLMLRGVAAGVGVSYESLSRDYSQSNYSSARLALLDDRDLWRVLQSWYVTHFLQDVYEDFLDMAVLAGELKFPDYETNRERYCAVRWQSRGWDWVDPYKEVQAARMSVRAGFQTAQDIISSKGGDFEDTFRQRRREVDLAAELDLVFDSDAAQVSEKGVAQPNPAPAEIDTDQPGGTADA